MRERTCILLKLRSAKHTHVFYPRYRRGTLVGRKALVPKDREALFQRKLEPVSAGNAIGPPLVIFLLDTFFRQQWLADAATRGLPTDTAQQAVTAVTSAVTSSPGVTSYSPDLPSLAAGLSVGVDYTTGVRLAMLILAAIPLCVAVWAYFMMPRAARVIR